MAHENRGKQFESQIRKAFLSVPNTKVTRLLDPQNGFAGVRNLCDFEVYHYPYQYMVECKSCYGNTLSFRNITDTQWQLADIDVYGVFAGYMVWFIDHDKTVWVPAKELKALKDAGHKSLHILKDEPVCFTIAGKKRRVLFDYDLTDFLQNGIYI